MKERTTEKVKQELCWPKTTDCKSSGFIFYHGADLSIGSSGESIAPALKVLHCLVDFFLHSAASGMCEPINVADQNVSTVNPVALPRFGYAV